MEDPGDLLHSRTRSFKPIDRIAMLASTLLLRSTSRSALALAPAAARALSTAAQPLVLVEKIDNYAVVRMNRPPVNSLNTAVCCWPTLRG
jgi:hypothetical protein